MIRPSVVLAAWGGMLALLGLVLALFSPPQYEWLLLGGAQASSAPAGHQPVAPSTVVGSLDTYAAAGRPRAGSGLGRLASAAAPPEAIRPMSAIRIGICQRCGPAM